MAVLLAPLLLCGASWASGGVPELTDAGFGLLALTCLVLSVQELGRLRTGGQVAPLVVYLGVMLWFCQDYLANWGGKGLRDSWPYTPALIARVATMHCLFVLTLTIGMGITWGHGRVDRWIDKVPEPPRDAYLWLILGLFGLGLIPYVFLTRDPLFVTFERAVTGFYAGGAKFTFGRTGNLNYDWSGYLFELIKLGKFGGVLAGIYALRVARGTLHKTIGWSIWCFWLLLAFGSGTRGQLLFMTMPLLVILLLSRGGAASRLVRQHRVRSLLVAATLAVLVFALMQVQTQLRSKGLRSAEDLRRVDLGELQGNHMFSEGLAAWELIPDRRLPFHDSFPGEGAARALPETLFRIAIHPIPRALWTTKPVDEVWAWYNELVVGTVGESGTTISTGLPGWWYFRYGLLGLIQGGLFIGWLYSAADRALGRARLTQGTLALLIPLAVIAWLFRCFRDFGIGELYEIVIPMAGLIVLARLLSRRPRVAPALSHAGSP